MMLCTSALSFFSLGQHLVELMLSKHGAQRGLGEHIGGRKVVLNLDDGAFGIDHVEVEYRIDLHRNVVARNHVLGGYFDDLNSQVHAHHFLKERNQQYEAGSLDFLKPTKREDNSPLVFAKNPYAGPDDDYNEDQENGGEIEKIGIREHDATPFRPIETRTRYRRGKACYFDSADHGRGRNRRLASRTKHGSRSSSRLGKYLLAATCSGMPLATPGARAAVHHE